MKPPPISNPDKDNQIKNSTFYKFLESEILNKCRIIDKSNKVKFISEFYDVSYECAEYMYKEDGSINTDEINITIKLTWKDSNNNYILDRFSGYHSYSYFDVDVPIDILTSNDITNFNKWVNSVISSRLIDITSEIKKLELEWKRLNS